MPQNRWNKFQLLCSRIHFTVFGFIDVKVKHFSRLFSLSLSFLFWFWQNSWCFICCSQRTESAPNIACSKFVVHTQCVPLPAHTVKRGAYERWTMKRCSCSQLVLRTKMPKWKFARTFRVLFVALIRGFIKNTIRAADSCARTIARIHTHRGKMLPTPSERLC